MHIGTAVLWILILLILWTIIERKLLVISKYVITSSKLSEKLDHTNLLS